MADRSQLEVKLPIRGMLVGFTLAGVPWTRWVRFMAPLQLLFLAAGFACLTMAVAVGWGPF